VRRPLRRASTAEPPGRFGRQDAINARAIDPGLLEGGALDEDTRRSAAAAVAVPAVAAEGAALIEIGEQADHVVVQPFDPLGGALTHRRGRHRHDGHATSSAAPAPASCSAGEARYSRTVSMNALA
jgi:hypothetical protein